VPPSDWISLVKNPAPTAPPMPAISTPSVRAPRRGRRLGWGATALVVVLGIALRTYTRSALWLDEAISVEISSLPLRMVDGALRHDGAPPLYALLLWMWERLFGDSPVATRALSSVFGIGAFPLMAMAGRRVAGASGGPIALLLLASSPFAVYYSTEARMYSLVVLLVLCGFLALDGYLHAPGRWRGAVVSLVAALLALTHYWTLFLLAVVAGALLLRAWLVRSGPDARAVGWMALGGLLFLPWLPSFLFQLGHTGTPWGDPAGLSAALESVGEWAGGSWSGGKPKPFALLLVLLGLLGAGAGRITGYQVVFDLRGRPPGRALAVVVGGTLILGLVMGRLSGDTFAGRYTSVVFPLFLLLVAVGLTRLPRTARTVTLVLVVLLGLAGAIPNVARTDKTQAADLASALSSQARPGDVIVYCPDQLGPAVSRLLPAGLHQQVYPTGGPPSRVDWVDYEQRNRAADPDSYGRRLSGAAGDHAIWLVSNPDYRTYEGQCEGLARALTTLRGQPLCLVERDDFYFENADLRGWAPKDERHLDDDAATGSGRRLLSCPTADVAHR